MNYDPIQNMILEEKYQEAIVLLRLRLREQERDRVALEFLKLCLRLQEKAQGVPANEELLASLEEMEDLTPVDEEDSPDYPEALEQATSINQTEELNWKSFIQLVVREYIHSVSVGALRLLKYLPDHKTIDKLKTFFTRKRDLTFFDEVEKLKNWKRKLVFWTPARRVQFGSVLLGLIIFCIGLIGILLCLQMRSADEVETIPRDPEELLFRAREGDPESQYLLGFQYYYGSRHLNRDKVQSYYWLTQASKQGHKEATSLLHVLTYEQAEQRKLGK